MNLFIPIWAREGVDGGYTGGSIKVDGRPIAIVVFLKLKPPETNENPRRQLEKDQRRFFQFLGTNKLLFTLTKKVPYKKIRYVYFYNT